MIREIIKYIVFTALSLACSTRVRAGSGTAQEANLLSGNGRWAISYLRQPRQFQATTQLQHKAFFASYTQCDVYDFITRRWSRADFKNARRNVAACSGNTRAYFAGGETGRVGDGNFSCDIDVYDITTGTWSLTKLSQPRQVSVAISAKDEALFAGGVSKYGVTDRVDIINTASGKHSKYQLSVARDRITGAAINNILVLAGGMAALPCDVVDIYSADNKTWAVTRLSAARYGMSVAKAGNTIFFAGGITTTDSSVLSNKIDIYNTTTDSWMVIELQEAKYGMATAIVGNKVCFIGGYLGNGQLSDKIELYDVVSRTWSYATMQHPRAGMAVAQTQQYLMLAGGHIKTTAQCTDRVEVLDITTGHWQASKLTKPRVGITAAVYNDEIIFAGGSMVDRSKNMQPFYGEVETWRQTDENTHNVFYTSGEADAMLSYSQIDTTLMVNLTELQYSQLTVRLLNEQMECTINNEYLPVGPTAEPLKLGGLPYGQYWLVIEGGLKPIVRKINYGDAIEQYAVN